MSIGIGIDTGGTYTDIVLFDRLTNKILATAKTPTTKSDLSVGIKNAIELLPSDLVKKAKVMALSTTLATNACVEKKGGRGKMIFVGVGEQHLKFTDVKTHYNLDKTDIYCLPKMQDGEDFENTLKSKEMVDFLEEAQSVAITEYKPSETGAFSEKKLLLMIKDIYELPVVAAHEVALELNVFERGATAFLNARLLPVMQEFIDAIKKVLTETNLSIHTMVVRSDGSLMAQDYASLHPVKTILSGPAASVVGGRYLANTPNAIIIDMGGTTTDISIVEKNEPVMVKGVKIGGYRTQVPGVFIDTFALGGDSRIYIDNHRLHFDNRRVEPLCVAGKKYPQVKTYLENLVESKRKSGLPLHEFLVLIKMPSDLSRYTKHEQELLKKLQNGILSFTQQDDIEFDFYHLKSERLENEGLVLRCGLTPTDIMHIKGDFVKYDVECAKLGAQFAASQMYHEDMDIFCEQVYEHVCETLYTNIIRILLSHERNEYAQSELDENTLKLVRKAWRNAKSPHSSMFKLNFLTEHTLVGVGAPTGIFLPKVASALQAECIIPEHSQVANAVGAIISDISAEVHIEILQAPQGEDLSGNFIIYDLDGNKTFDDIEEAIEFARKIGMKKVEKECRLRGALGELNISCEVDERIAHLETGMNISLGTQVVVKATDRVIM